MYVMALSLDTAPRTIEGFLAADIGRAQLKRLCFLLIRENALPSGEDFMRVFVELTNDAQREIVVRGLHFYDFCVALRAVAPRMSTSECARLLVGASPYAMNTDQTHNLALSLTTTSEKAPMILYALINNRGQYFRAKGRGGYGRSWVDDIQDANIYPKLSQARSRVTYFSNQYGPPAPQLIELRVVGQRVIDETARLANAAEKKKAAAAARASRRAEYELEAAQKRLAAAQAEVDKLKGRK